MLKDRKSHQKSVITNPGVVTGEPPTRAHSEARSWGGAGAGSGPQSAPPELIAAGAGAGLSSRQQQKLTEHNKQQSGYKSPESESVSLGSFSGTNGHKEQEDSLGERDSPLATIAKDEVYIYIYICTLRARFRFFTSTVWTIFVVR